MGVSSMRIIYARLWVSATLFVLTLMLDIAHAHL
jgi:hypothetical protein